MSTSPTRTGPRSEDAEGAKAPTRAPLGLIVVVAKGSGAIGRNNALLWHIREDLKHFKRTTSGHAIIMGRRTFESLGSKPLPKRHNIVVSRTLQAPAGEAAHPNLTIVSSLQDALTAARAPHATRDAAANGDAAGADTDDHTMPFVIGGSAIYDALLPQVTHVVLTEVDRDAPDADAFFHLPEDEFVETRREAAETEGVTFRWLTRR